ncbi:hypothetical protein EDD86DRAFT_197632 [Gorgonomyces haynaldii]|nr:hypothetical protein EDD86DRAFT_197632 [Gorgonomyces haynaldii]
MIVLCDGVGCDIPVHQRCYGIEHVPPGEEKWHCQRCDDGVQVENTNVICCPLRTGAFKRCNIKGGYVHVICAWWNGLIDSKTDPDKYKIQEWALDKQTCYICSKTMGLVIKCKETTCKKRLHVTCGVEKELITLDAESQIQKYDVFCQEHLKDGRKSTKRRSVQDDFVETETEVSESEREDISTSIKRAQTKAQETPKAQDSPQSLKPPEMQKQPSNPSKQEVKNGPKIYKQRRETVFSPDTDKKVSTPVVGNAYTEKLQLLKATIAELEQLQPPEKKSVVQSSPLDSLMTNSYNDLSKTLQEKDSEIKQLRMQIQHLSEANSANKDDSMLSPKVTSQYHQLQEHVVNIMAHLKLPNLNQPTMATVDSFCATLSAILDRVKEQQDTKRINQAMNS